MFAVSTRRVARRWAPRTGWWIDESPIARTIGNTARHAGTATRVTTALRSWSLPDTQPWTGRFIHEGVITLRPVEQSGGPFASRAGRAQEASRARAPRTWSAERARAARAAATSAPE